MQYRKLGKTNIEVSAISLGTWQVGGQWGSEFNFANAEKILHTAADAGVNFIDTADVYSAGLSEEAVGKFVKSRKDKIYVASKCGRQINPHVNEGYTPKILRKYVEDSLKRMGLNTLDLIQLHCPPTQVYYRPEIFGEFELLKAEGKIQHLGISVEKVEEALKGIEFDNVGTVQIIFNMFRQRPADLFFEQAQKKNVGVIVRVPLASGLLSGKYSKQTEFGEGDHRNFNRDGAAFDKGETFAGIDYDTALEAVAMLKQGFGAESNLAAQAIRWILGFEAVSTVIPGASKPEQVLANLEALNLPALDSDKLALVQTIYNSKIKNLVHHLW